MTYLSLLPALVSGLVLVSGPVFAAGSEPVQFSEEGPWIAIPAGSSVDLGPLSAEAIKAMADLDGNPNVTTAKEIAMIAVLLQVLGGGTSMQMDQTD